MDMSDMFKVFRKELDWGGRKLVLETGKIARQADGAVLATYGDTIVLCTAVVFEKQPKPGLDFFPLTVNYQEKTFAAGKIPGGFFKREGRPSEKEVLTSRLIDRPIRPLFAEGFRNETQVIATVLSHDLENDPDIVAMIGASAALTLSGIPFLGPIAARPRRLSSTASTCSTRRSTQTREAATLDLVVAGTAEGVLMVESRGQGAVRGRHARRRHVRPSSLPAGDRGDHRAGRALPPRSRGRSPSRRRSRQDGRRPSSSAASAPSCAEAYAETPEAGAPRARSTRSRPRPRSCSRPTRPSRRRLGEHVQGPRSRRRPRRHPRHRQAHRRPRHQDRAPDRRRGRRAAARPRLGAVHPRRDPGARASPRSAPARTSRSSTRSRASTASTSCCTTTSRPTRSARRGRMGSPGRREIGHGKLAWRALRPLLPAKDKFPYTIRVVSRDHRDATAPPRWRRCAAPRCR